MCRRPIFRPPAVSELPLLEIVELRSTPRCPAADAEQVTTLLGLRAGAATSLPHAHSETVAEAIFAGPGVPELLLERIWIRTLLELPHDLLHFTVQLLPGEFGHPAHHAPHRLRIVLVDVRELTLHRAHRRLHPGVLHGIVASIAQRRRRVVGFPTLGDRERGN